MRLRGLLINCDVNIYFLKPGEGSETAYIPTNEESPLLVHTPILLAVPDAAQGQNAR